MNLNSQFSFYPPQPDNPADSDRDFLTRYALTEQGRIEDFPYIKQTMKPPHPITSYAPAGSCRHLKVGVIGGGLAGLAAAFELRKLGFNVTVFDSLKDRIGGRVYTYYFDRDKTLYGELAPMRIPVSHDTVWHYLQLFRLPTRPFIQTDHNAFLYFKNTRIRNDKDGTNMMNAVYPKYGITGWERSLSWQKLMYIGIESALLAATPEERAEILQVKPVYNQKTLQWDRETNLQTMQRAGLSQEAISLVSNMSTVLFGNLYNNYIDYIEEGYPVSTSYLYEIPGGMQRLPMAFYQSFASQTPEEYYRGFAREQLGGVNYHSGTTVGAIRLDNSGSVVLDYRSCQEEPRRESFDYVICAIPFSTLRNMEIDPLFSPLKMRAIREVNYAPAQKTILLCKERFWERQGIVGGGAYTDLPLVSLWYPSDHAKYVKLTASGGNPFENLPADNAGVLTGSYNFDLDTTRLTNMPEHERHEHIKRNVERVHGLPPGYLDRVVEDIVTVNWDQEPAFRGSLCFFAPEQKRIFSYSMVLPEYRQRVFFAGEHISAAHRWMQGALQSGMQAANDLAAACLRHSQK